MTRFAYALSCALFCLLILFAAPASSAPSVPPPVGVTLVVEKKVFPAAPNEPPTWQPLGSGKAVVLPGDILRYTVTGRSRLARPIQGFVLTQPVPRGTEYRLQSSSASGEARMTISLDGGKTYTENPTIKVAHPDGKTTDEPAPAARYTTLRWEFLHDLPPLGSAWARCEVRVR